MKKIFLLCTFILMMTSTEVYADEIANDNEILKINEENTININDSKSNEENIIDVDDSKENEKDLTRNIEIQLEYFNGKIFNNRNVNNYNFHVFQQFKQIKSLELYRGLTVTRATGYSRPRNKGWLDSEGVGVGPAFMLRYKKQISGKLHLAGDFTGSLMFYNKAHPAEGRAYGFLWRIGPRLLWQATKRDAVSLGYSVSHFSNGLRSHNPGYNGVGFTLNFQHKF